MKAAAPPGLPEPILAFAAATAVAAGLFWLTRLVPDIEGGMHAAIAVTFLYAPGVAARIAGTPFDYRAAGLTAEPLGRGLATAGLVALATWPIFLAGFLAFYGATCAPDAGALVRTWGDMFAPLCPRWLGPGGAALRVPPDFALLALSHVVVVALPEEVFFRGYLLQRLEARWPPARTLLGARVGPALVASSALFALGHVLVDLDPGRLAVFFPGLAFGWLRARTGSLLAPTLYHAGCNLVSEILHASFFR